MEEYSHMAELEEIESLVKKGQTREALGKEMLFLKDELISEDERGEAFGWGAWAYYRRKEFEKAEIEAKKAGNNETALKCLAAIAAYFHKDQDLVKLYTNKLPDSPGKDNAKTIAARNPNDNTSKEEIMKRAEKWIAIPEIWDPSNTANLLNNTMRWLLEKGEGDDDLMTALRFIEKAIELYGDGDYNLHHRASAHFWISIIKERLFSERGAVSAATMSVYLWEKQLTIDPDNEHFQNSLSGARKRLKDLNKNYEGILVV